ncbi:MAG TPA: acyltransferase [Ktedonobacteraceae bacterium]|nr:acyltransferase [Ktedonobacteraceae bacterium]
MTEKQTHRSHIYELDPLRAITAWSVVAVHTLSGTVNLNTSDLGVQLQNAGVVALHFTREVFIFVTAFALVYVYYGKPFALKRFWARRSLSVLLPYCIWSMVYIRVNIPGQSPIAFIKTAFIDILTGNASYQLYYILITLQFYIILPLFLLFLKRFAKHPWKALALSFVIQVVLFYIDYHLLQQGPLASSGFWKFVSQYQDRFVFAYQFYFVLGGFTALYFQQIRSFLLRYGWMVACGMVAAISILWLHYTLQIRVYQESLGYATSVLQPVMVFYSLAVILFGCWLACLWASHKNREGYPSGYRLWRMVADASFGVFLIHVLLLAAILKWIVPAMPLVWPVALRVVLTWIMVAGSATILSIMLLKTPILSRLVGREYAAQRNIVQKAGAMRSEAPRPATEPVHPAKLVEQGAPETLLGKRGGR